MGEVENVPDRVVSSGFTGGRSMIHDEEFETTQATFLRLDWRLQVTFVTWVIGVAVIMIGLKLFTANAAAVLTMIP